MRAARLVVLAIALAAPAASADEPPPPDEAAVAEARRRFTEGQKLFERGELKPAVEEFKEAYRLTRNPLLLYNIGFVYDKLGDEPLALHYYTRFIEEARDTERTREQLTAASTRAAELRARLAIEDPPAPATQPAEPPAPPEPRELAHEPVDQAPPGKPIDVVAKIPRDVPWTVTLHYRAPGVDRFQATPMRPLAPGAQELVARVPAGALRDGSLQYYIAARDPEGKLASSSGRAGTPHIVVVDPEAPPHLILPADAEAGPVPPVPPPVPVPREPDRPTRPLTYAKWAASGAGVALLATGVGLHLAARDYSETLEGEAIKSSNPGNCAVPPCSTYENQRKNLEATGKRYETWSNVTLIGGLLAGAGAGLLWYLDFREAAAIPIVAPGTLGAAAVMRF